MSEERPYWINDGNHNEEIASYVLEGDDFVEEQVKAPAINELRRVTNHRHQAFPAALAGNRNDRRAMAEALYLRLSDDFNFTYDYERDFHRERGQLLRLPGETGNKQLGTCIDLTVLFLSCLANVKLWPIYLQISGPQGDHALAATWLNKPFSNDRQIFIDAETILEDLKKPAENRGILILESTGFAVGVPQRQHKISFAEAQDEAAKCLANSQIAFALDITQAWARGIEPVPLPQAKHTDGSTKGRKPATSNALATWQERLEFLHEKEAIVSDPAQQFSLKKQIEEAEQKIRELGG